MQYFNIESTRRALDDVDWHILSELQKDARLTYAEIGRRVGLSSPAVAERVHRLEEAGVITGYSANRRCNEAGSATHRYFACALSGGSL